MIVMRFFGSFRILQPVLKSKIVEISFSYLDLMTYAYKLFGVHYRVGFFDKSRDINYMAYLIWKFSEKNRNRTRKKNINYFSIKTKLYRFKLNKLNYSDVFYCGKGKLSYNTFILFGDGGFLFG